LNRKYQQSQTKESLKEVQMALYAEHQRLMFRSSQRLTITVAHSTLEALVDRSQQEGRSLSNLAAYLLENALEDHED
jgi:hypothetical protein